MIRQLEKILHLVIKQFEKEFLQNSAFRNINRYGAVLAVSAPSVFD